VDAYPLTWPPGRPRTPPARRARSRFATTFARARDEVVRELRLLRARAVVLSTNVALRRDGLPLAGQRSPADSGVAVYFQSGGRPLCFACDRWAKVEDNLWAVAKTIDALRGIARWGTGDMVETAFAGFQALPAAAAGPPWHEVLGVDPGAAAAEVAEAIRRATLTRHPDRGGSPAAWHELQEALAALPPHLRPA
jgi:hypothetical protein